MAAELATESENFLVVNVIVPQRTTVGRATLDTSFGVYGCKSALKLFGADKRTLHLADKTTPILSRELSRLLALFGDQALDHLVLGNLLAAQGGFGMVKFTESPHVVGRLTSFLYVSKQKTAVVINTAKPGSIHNQFINLEHFFLENSFRPYLKEKAVNEVLVYNVELSDRDKHVEPSFGFIDRSHEIYYTGTLLGT